ncbi:MAG: EpsI family protein [Candidatus Omnitrophica bacterium CG12_big_fil_rev_8_21_14_0_65_45_16]|nr:MAG: EpsI family protein [Candidatus Omnitrophica bacterium CG12_big_fil_rev_8_21_14_0_65_45_16]
MFGWDKSYRNVALLFTGLAFFPLAMPTAFHIDEVKSPLFESFPYQINEWQGKEEPVDDRTYEILETRNVLSRIYENAEGDKIHLLLVGSKKDRRVAHPPEVCYLSSNYGITQQGQETLDIQGREIPVKEFVAVHERNTDDSQRVLYVYKIGDKFTTNYYSQQLRFALDRFTNQDSEVLLIRLAGSSRESFSSFLTDVLPHL